jgi:predicted nucleic acid-binding protein
MTTRSILLDAGFVAALTDTKAPLHADAAELYRTLIDAYVARTIRMFALSSTLAVLPTDARRGVLAPVETLYVSRQHLSASSRVDAEVSPELALTLVMLAREKISTVVTLGADHGSSDYDAFDLEVIALTAVAKRRRSPELMGPIPSKL